MTQQQAREVVEAIRVLIRVYVWRDQINEWDAVAEERAADLVCFLAASAETETLQGRELAQSAALAPLSTRSWYRVDEWNERHGTWGICERRFDTEEQAHADRAATVVRGFAKGRYRVVRVIEETVAERL